MSETYRKPNVVSGAIYTIAILGTFLIIGWLVWLMLGNRPAPIGATRSEARYKAAAELKSASTEALTAIAWQDEGRGLVRLPIDHAKKLTVQKWQNPSAARADLLSRVDKATAPAPKAPERPSEFE
ncbi:MAG: hypothetical protein ACK4UN_07350 [Limisphaerales bacterium]